MAKNKYKHTVYPPVHEMAKIIKKLGYREPATFQERIRHFWYALTHYYKFNEVKRKWERKLNV